MSQAVVVVGPIAVRGPGPVDADLVSAALDSIDDDLALVDERVVAVDDVWQEVLSAALAGSHGSVVLICPSWWTTSRIARVEAAALPWSATVTVRRRIDVLAAGSTVAEVGPQFVLVHADGQRQAVARVGSPAGVVAAVVSCVDGFQAVTVDLPSGLALFGAELARALRRRGIAVTIADDSTAIRAARGQHADVIDAEPSPRRRAITPRVAVLAAAVLSVTALAAAAVGLGGGSTGTVDAAPGTWLIEGRVAVEVPAQWTAERITSGPGSARVQVVSPSDSLSAIQVTQSRVPDDQTLDMTAEALRLALADEPAGVFVDFTADGRRGQRPVVSYREIRADHHVEWAVLLDRGVRIAIGCQGPPSASGLDQLCDRAIRSAHTVT